MTAMCTIDHIHVANVGGLPLHYPIQPHDMCDILDVEEIWSNVDNAASMTVANIMYIGSGGGGNPAMPINLKRCIEYFFWMAYTKYQNPIEVDEDVMTPSEKLFIEWWEEKYKDVVCIEPPIDMMWWSASQITEVYKYYLQQEAQWCFATDLESPHVSTTKPALVNQIIMNVVYATIHEIPLDYLVKHNIIDEKTKDIIDRFKKGMCIFKWEVYSWAGLGITQELFGLQDGRRLVDGNITNFTVSDFRNNYREFDEIGSQLNQTNLIAIK